MTYRPLSMRGKGHRPIDTPEGSRSAYIVAGKPWEEEYMDSVRERDISTHIKGHIMEARRFWGGSEQA